MEGLYSKEKLLRAAEQPALPHTGSSPAKAGNSHVQGQSSAGPPCWADSDIVLPLENTWRKKVSSHGLQYEQ